MKLEPIEQSHYYHIYYNYETYRFSYLSYYVNNNQPEYFKLEKEYVVQNLFYSLENLKFVHRGNIDMDEGILGIEDEREKGKEGYLKGGLRQHLTEKKLAKTGFRL